MGRNETKIEFKYCHSTGDAGFLVVAPSVADAEALTDKYMTKFYDLFMQKIIMLMKKTEEEQNKFLATMADMGKKLGMPPGKPKEKCSCGNCGSGGPEDVHKPVDPDDPAVA